MKFVGAKKEPRVTELGFLAVGDHFRYVDNPALMLRLGRVGAGRASVMDLSTTEIQINDCPVIVIPARVLLVEKGADLEEVRKALEEL